MILKNKYWHFTSAIKESLCDDIVNQAKKLKNNTAGINKQDSSKLTKEKTIDLKKTRDSNIVWMKDSWIYELIIPYINQANVNAEWNFDWNFLENCQFTTYKKDQHYGWHTDSFNEPHNNPNDLEIHGKIRKLSVTLNLSNPKEYTGGELEFYFNNGSPDGRESDKQMCTEILPKGSIVVFPSHIWHRVKPVTSGERKSLVIWTSGYPFK